MEMVNEEEKRSVVKQELHDLLVQINQGGDLTTKDLARICKISASSIRNHRGNKTEVWMSERTARSVLERLEAYLEDPRKESEVTVTGSGEVIAFTSGSVQRIIDELIKERNKVIEEAQKKAESIMTAIQVLRKTF